MASRTHNTAPGKAAAAGATRGRWTLKPSKQTCYALAGLMGVGFIGGAGLYTWQKAQIDALSRQVAQKQEQVDSGEKIARRLIASESAYAETQSQLQYLETSVTAGQYVPTLLRQMENLAKSVNLQVSSIRPKLEPAPAPPADKEARKSFKPWPYDKIHVDMEVRGNYWSVARLLYRLTEFPKILAVSSVQVQSQGEVKTGSSPVLTAT
jgi:Tfp pilus assembly protein PilO